MTAKMIDYQGKLALTWGWEANRDRPIEERWLSISDIKSEDYPLVIDQIVSNISSNSFTVCCRQTYQYLRFDSTNWNHLTETRPIKKPKPGKNKIYGEYDWEWIAGKWYRRMI